MERIPVAVTNAPIVALAEKYMVNGVELSGLEWNTLLRLGAKCGCDIVTAKAEKAAGTKGKPANLYTVNAPMVFTIEKMDSI